MILEVWGGASPADVKTILTETSTPVTGGKAWEGFTLWDPYRGVQVGLVHIGRAVKLARFMALVVRSGLVRSLEAASSSSSSPKCSAEIILGQLRGMKSSSGSRTLAIRGDEPFQEPTHFVSYDEAVARFGISKN